MMKEGMFRKGLACCVIFLFIGAATTCVTVNYSKAKYNTAENKDSFKVTFQIFSTEGIEGYKMILSSEQFNELKNLIQNIKSEFVSAKNKEETNLILNEAVTSLNEMGLIRGNHDVEEVKKYVTGSYLDEKGVDFLSRSYNKNQQNAKDDPYNVLSFVFASTTWDSHDISLLSIVGLTISIIGWFNPLRDVGLSLYFYAQFKPLHVFNEVLFRNDENTILSCGLLGIKNNTVGPKEIAFYGFTGIKILFPRNFDVVDYYYLGNSLLIGKYLKIFDIILWSKT